jgi:thiamine-monophosphate kinase
MKKNSEFSIIDKFFKPLTKNNQEISLGLCDDTASFEIQDDEKIIVSKDMIVEDVHFLKKSGAKKIAAKLLLSNLSDMAASGAKPLYYLLGFSKNDEMNEQFIAEFASSLQEIQEKYKISLIGGDTVKTSQKLFFSVTIFGVCKKNQSLARKNANEGDLIFTSGAIGDAHIGLLSLLDKISFENEDDKNYFLNRHFFPTPRIELGQELLAQDISNCAIDVSDGFLADLNHICQASKLDAVVFQEKIPFSKQAKKYFKQVSKLDLISGGEDYELIFCVKKNDKNKILALAKKLNINLNYVGFFKKSTSPKIQLFDEENNEIKIENYGYQH